VNEDLRALGDEYWEAYLAHHPTVALLKGDHRYNEQFEDASEEGDDAWVASLRDFAVRAQQIDPETLSAEDRNSREVLIFETTSAADMIAMRTDELAVNHAIGYQAYGPVTQRQIPLAEPEHADAMITRFQAKARALDQMAARLRAGVARGRTPTDHEVSESVKQLDAIMATHPKDDPFAAIPAPPSFTEAEEESWRERIGDVIRDHFRPALQRYRDTIVDHVAPVARSITQPGLSYLPDGEETYARAIKRYTTLDTSAGEIHEVGMQQIAGLAEEYRELGQEVLGTSNLKDIFSQLRDDPELHFTTGAAAVQASEEAFAKARAEMHNWFGRLPIADCVVAETSSGPTAFYFPPPADNSRPGTFYLNTADPTRWGTFEIEAMAFHEGIPGHHLQLAIAQELEDVPEFRKYARVTAYIEGWGLYTERLADEMALYSGPLARIGMLSADSMRAGRLVVDTGIHAMGWSRRQAIEFMEENSPISPSTIAGEIDRYIGMPGQALAYMMGRLEIMEIRARAEDQLGDRFDIKGFHDVVLGSGPVPLDTLGRMVAEWADAV
jgi:uncharacterized protein (DUF885 family)